MNGDGRFALEPAGSSGSGWSDDMMMAASQSPVRVGGESEGGLLLSPKNVHALRTLFEIAHRLASTLGKSWALVRPREIQSLSRRGAVCSIRMNGIATVGHNITRQRNSFHPQSTQSPSEAAHTRPKTRALSHPYKPQPNQPTRVVLKVLSGSCRACSRRPATEMSSGLWSRPPSSANRCWRRCRTWSARCSRRTLPRRTGRGQHQAGRGPMEGHCPATACRRTWPSSLPPPRG
jgi:hypothetical protein